MHEHDYMEEDNFKIEYIKYFSLIAILAVLAVFLNNWFGAGDSSNVMRWFMGLVFLTLGTFKFIGYEMFTEVFPEYDIIAARSKFYTYFYPFLELGLGVMYLLNIFPIYRDVITFAIMSVGAYGIYMAIKSEDNDTFYCACLGNIIKLPLRRTSLIEDIIMAAMALFVLISNL